MLIIVWPILIKQKNKKELNKVNILSKSKFNNTILNTTFTATAQTSFIYLEASGVQLDVDYVRISRSDIPLRKLVYISYDNFLQIYKVTDDTNNSGNYSDPLRVYILPDHSAFGVSPRPNKSEYTVSYDYYTTHSDLSAHGDNMSLPDRFVTLVEDRAKYYTYMLWSDPQHAQLADRDFQRKLRLLKVDYATKNDYMRSDTIAESIATNIGGRVA